MTTFETPILILVFNRPDSTRQLLRILADVKPTKLYVGCDGARNAEEQLKVAEVRELIANEITWPCAVFTQYQETNLGLRAAVSGAISWFLKKEELGIILEDDCHPLPAFFTYSASLLDRYAHENQVMHISGNNLLPEPTSVGYYASKYPRVWGWATWRRAWAHYDDSDKFLNTLTPTNLKKSYPRGIDLAFWQLIVEKLRLPNSRMRKRSWAYFWALNIRMRNGICLQPTTNLIRNVGFDSSATNTANSARLSQLSGDANAEMDFQLSHPENLSFVEEADNHFVDRILIDSRVNYVKVLIKRFFPFLKARH